MATTITITTAKSRLKIISLCFCSLVALAAGTPYLYGIYSPQLISRCQFTTSDSSILSFASNIGSSLGGFLAGLFIDSYGVNAAVLLGSGLEFSGFLILYLCYRFRIHSFLLLTLALYNVGFGSVMAFFATIKVSTVNFPNNRGAANSCNVSAYGLAALFYATVSTAFFSGNTQGLLGFIAIFTGVVIGTASIFIRIYENEDDELHHGGILNENEENGDDLTGIDDLNGGSKGTSTHTENATFQYLLKGHRGSFAQVNLIRSNSTASLFTMSTDASSSISRSSSFVSQDLSRSSSFSSNSVSTSDTISAAAISINNNTNNTVNRPFKPFRSGSSSPAQIQLAMSRSSGQLAAQQNTNFGSFTNLAMTKQMMDRTNSYRQGTSLSNSPKINQGGSFPKRKYTVADEVVIDDGTDQQQQQQQPLLLGSTSDSPGAITTPKNNYFSTSSSPSLKMGRSVVFNMNDTDTESTAIPTPTHNTGNGNYNNITPIPPSDAADYLNQLKKSKQQTKKKSKSKSKSKKKKTRSISTKDHLLKLIKNPLEGPTKQSKPDPKPRNINNSSNITVYNRQE
ncbi:unnamed protein product [Ambrosiozyma monospora]|uniref:Unnamed protein product n=1 Tax=Ambrosiozyma monospora TaxID=43982 RepID=A0A9W7DJD8_AMBMO|nr:unnamed protein product [Ambrosiozyma monospora]